MKLTPEQKKHFEDIYGDNERVHIEYDRLMRQRLGELDFEFMQDLNEAVDGVVFWYA